MSTPFVLTPSAARDLDDILEYILDESGMSRAVHVHARLLEGISKIASHPGIGHLREDLADKTLRVWVVFSYLIIYRSDTRPVQILRVLHGARDLPSAFDEGWN